MKKLLVAASLLLSLSSIGQTFTFTNAGASGATGPTQSQLDTEYQNTDLQGNVISANGIQEWIVPFSGLYRIEASGAAGGNTSNPGGKGANMQGEFLLTQGDVLKILVGQKGADATSTGGGGGGTFVVNNGTLLLAAGGGGGATSDNGAADGATSTSGTNDYPGGTTPGGTNGDGGAACTGIGGASANHGGGGGGYYTDGATSADNSPGDGGYSFLNGGAGGVLDAPGGFGGGGGSGTTGTGGGGGGGGYSGGAGGQQINYCTPGIGRSGGGGGGSYNMGLNQINLAGVQSGHGQVIIEVLSSGAHDDAGVISLSAPDEFCPGNQTVKAVISNFGVTIIDSVIVNWSVNSVLQAPVSVTTPLDTIGGTGSSNMEVTLGTYTFSSALYNINVWTSSPNGVADTVTANDTIRVPVQSGLSTPGGLSVSNVASYTADVSWTFNAPAYEIIYGSVGFDPSSAGVTVSAPASPHTLTGLSTVTAYDVYLYATCGGSVNSDTIGPVSFTTLCAPSDILSGAYTIDGTQPTAGTNFNSFSDAAANLNSCGINGPVVFNVAPGTYTDSLVLNEITGASATNTVTFNGGSASAVTLTYSSASDAPTVHLDGADYIIFKNMTIESASSSDAWGIMLQNGADHNTIDSCLINMPVGTTTDVIGIVASGSLAGETTSGDNVNYLTVTNCEIRGGESGIHLEGPSSSPYNTNNVIRNNIFRQQDDHAIEVDGQINLLVQGNDIDSLNNSGADAVYLANSNDFQVLENKIVSPGWGLYVLDGNDGTGTTVRSKIVNNMVYSPDDDAIYLNDIESTDIFHNSTSGAPGFAINDEIALDIRNNIFSSVSGVAFDALDDPIDNSTVINYNLYYSGGTDLIEVGSTVYTDLTSWQAANTALNVNSVSGDPFFAGTYDLHVSGLLANEAGDNSVGVTVDIDGDSRPSAGATVVDMGADEYLPPACSDVAGFSLDSLGFSNVIFTFENVGDNYEVEIDTCGFTLGSGTTYTGTDPFHITGLNSNDCYEVYVRRDCGTDGFSGWTGPFAFTTICSPAQQLSGTYTIDPGQPTGGTNFTSFADAFDVMYVCGISGPVIFNIAPGTYTENLVLTEINGASAANTVTFNGGSVSAVTLTYSSSSDEPTVHLDGADHIVLKNMTIESTSSSDAWGVMLQNGADHNTIDSCLINMPVGTTSDIIGIVASGSLSAETTTGNNTNYLTVTNCEIRGGETGIHLEGASSSPYNTDNVIRNNTFRQQDDHSIEVDGQVNLVIRGNDIDSLNNSGADAVYLVNVDDFQVLENKIISPGYGLYVNDGNDGTGTTVRSKIVNNMVYSPDDDAIYLNDIENTDVFHNSTSGVPGIAINDEEGLDIRNNIFTSVSGLAFDALDDPIHSSTVIDYNLYSGGAELIEVGSIVYADLASWQAASTGLNVNSLSGKPIYIGTYDLHAAGTLANESGDNSVGVTVDIDGDARPSAGATVVDMGADEYTPPPCPDVASFSINGLTADGGIFSFDSNVDNFNVEVGPCGFTQGTGTVNTTGTSPFTVTGLNSNTCYDLYVRRACGPDGSSNWDGPYSFTTECSAAQRLSGTYTLDPSQPASATNFTSFNAVADILNVCGVSGPVVINVAQGTYSEQVELLTIVDASATNNVVFQADPANTAAAELTYGASGSGDNYVFKFNGTSYVTLKDLTLTASGSTYARVVDMSGDGGHIVLNANILNGKADANSSSHNYTVISGNSGSANKYDSCIVKHNQIFGGSFGIYLNGVSASDREFGSVVDSNTVTGHTWSGISINYQANARIRGNVVNSGSTNNETYGIYSQGNSGVHYTGNMSFIKASTTTYGFYSTDDEGSASDPNIVTNNMIGALDNSGTAYGAYFDNNNYTYIYHNSVLVNAGSATGGRALYLNSTSSSNGNLEVLNNNLVNTGGGVAVEFNTTAASGGYVAEMDYNNLFSGGTDLGKFGSTSAADLAAWVTASQLDSNSVSGDPIYVAPDNLHVLGGFVNNAGTPVPTVTTDIDGEVRSSSTPDIGADEYTPVASDLALAGGGFKKNSFCLSSSDTAMVYIQNVVGGTVDFSVDSLTLHYSVSGPVTTSGMIVINTGTLSTPDSLAVMITPLDLSVAGVYTFQAWIDSNGVNSLAVNDTLSPPAEITIKPILTASPEHYTLTGIGDSARITASSPFFGSSGFFITEVSHYHISTGEPVGGWPSYLIADDYIEITGVPGSDLGGITLEQWNSSSMMGTYTFPGGTTLSPDGTAIIAVGQLGSSVESPSDYYYHGNGSFTSTFSSSGNNGRILKDSDGNIIDAVAYGSSYTFPAASGVTAADWSGNVGSSSSTSGIRLEGADNNDPTNWVISSASPQDPNVINANVVVPTASSIIGFAWMLNGVQVDTLASTYVGDTLSAPGDYEYIATFNSPCGVYTDTVVITVPTCSLPTDLLATAITADSATLSWTSPGGNAGSWTIIYGTTGFDPATGGTSVTVTTNPFTIGNLVELTDYDFYVIADCGSTDGVSDTAGPATFTTPCGIATAPFAESFSNGSLPDCWESYTTTTSTDEDAFWDFNGSATYATVTASGGTYAWVDGSAPFDETDVTLKTPLIDVSALTLPQLSFDLYIQNTNTANDNMSFTVNFFDGSNWHNGIYYEDDDLPGGFQRIELPLYNYTITGPVQFEFVVDKTVNGTSFYNDIVLDSVVVDEGPTCPRPLDVEITAVGSSSVTVGWSPFSGAQSYEIEYGLAGFQPGSGTPGTTTGNSVVIGSLTPNLLYEVYIRAHCGGSDYSTWIGPVEIFSEPVLCDDMEVYGDTLIEGQSSLFRGWANNGGDGEVTTAFAQSGTQSLHIHDSGSAGFTDIVAVFDTIESGIHNIRFSFYVPSGSAGYYNIQQRYIQGATGNLWAIETFLTQSGTVRVEAGTNGNGDTIGTFGYNVGQWNTIEHIIDLDNDTAYISMNGVNTNVGWQYTFGAANSPAQFNGVNFYTTADAGETPNYYVDDFCIVPTTFGGCSQPTGLAASVDCDSAVVSWNSNPGDFGVIEYGPAGFTPGSGGTMVTGISPFTIPGLTPGTDYDVYVADTCGSDTSSFAGPLTFTTADAPISAAFSATVNAPTSTDQTVDFDASASAGATTYSWDFGDGSPAGSGVTTTHSYTSDGTYYVTLTVTGSCGTSSDTDTIVISGIGIEENVLNRSLEVYPNPTTGSIQVHFVTESSDNATISIMDLSGKVILQVRSSDLNGEFRDQIDLSRLAKGTYMLRIESGDMDATRRVVKQ